MNNLYEQDFQQWLKQQVIALKDRNPALLDWDNLLEELKDLGRSDKRAIKSLLIRLYEHILKIVYWESERDRNLNSWKIEINAFRKQINRMLNESPSLKRYLDEIDQGCWLEAIATLTVVIEIPNTEQLVDWKTATTEFWFPE